MSVFHKIFVRIVLICAITVVMQAEEHDDIAKFNIKLSELDGSCRLERMVNQTMIRIEHRLDKLEHLLNQVIHKMHKNDTNRIKGGYSGVNHGWTERS